MPGGRAREEKWWRIRWFEGIREDIRNRSGAMYRSDWADGMKPKTLPTILFLYFACLAPAVAFGGISYGLTKGALRCVAARTCVCVCVWRPLGSKRCDAMR